MKVAVFVCVCICLFSNMTSQQDYHKFFNFYTLFIRESHNMSLKTELCDFEKVKDKVMFWYLPVY